MGEVSEIKELLKTTIEAMNSNLQFQQQMILELQKDNRQLREQMNDFFFNNSNSKNNLNNIFQNNIQSPIETGQSFFNSINNNSIEQINKQAIKYNPLEAEVINKFKRNKKRLIKNKILETIKANILSIPEIKEIIVDQQRYCSKASFYRYIEELRQHDFIHINNNTVKIKPLVEVV